MDLMSNIGFSHRSNHGKHFDKRIDVHENADDSGINAHCLSILVKVEWITGAPLPSTRFIVDSTTEFFGRVTGKELV